MTEQQMEEYIEKENPELILSSVDEEEYKDVTDNRQTHKGDIRNDSN